MAGDDDEAEGVSTSGRLAHRLTVVLTTSPIRTHPSTRLIEEVLESIHRLAGVGPDVKKVIVADGVKVRESSKFRAGVVTAEDDAGYRHYLERVHHLTRTPGSSLHGAELIALDERHGFAHALRRGLMRVSTPFVLVAQHDRSFVRPMDVEHVIDVMVWRAQVELGLTHHGLKGVRFQIVKEVN